MAQRGSRVPGHEPLTEDDLLPVEKKAMRELAPLLRFSDRSQCPLKDIQGQVLDIRPYKDIRGDVPSDYLSIAEKHRYRAMPKPLYEQLRQLEQEVVSNVGDDVLMSTVFPSASSAKEVSAFDGGPSFSFRVKSVSEDRYAVPISKTDAESLYGYANNSCFGREGSSEIFDEKVRMSVEYTAAELELPDFLQNPRAHFPELAHDVIARLCPDVPAAGIATVPYKMVGYSTGDFFAQHMDTMREQRHFATLAIHLPMESDYECKTDEMRPADQFSYTESTEDQEDSDSDSDDEEEEDAAAAAAAAAAAPRTVGGALRFFLGRALYRDLREEGDELGNDVPESALQNRMRGDYGKPTTSSQQLVASVVLSNYHKSELVDSKAAPVLAANRLARPVGERKWLGYNAPNEHHLSVVAADSKNNSSSSAGGGGAAAASSGSPTTKRSSSRRTQIPLHYCCWLASTLHDVRKLKQGFRFVMTYLVLRAPGPPAPLRIPRLAALDAKLLQVAETLRAERKKIAAASAEQGEMKLNRTGVPTTIGFVLRHFYAPGAMVDPSCLKGVDAVTYHAMFRRFEVTIAPVQIMRGLCESTAFDLAFDNDSEQPVVFLTAKLPLSLRLSTEGTDQTLFNRGFPLIDKVFFLQNAIGAVINRGVSFGNGDCTADYWYRSAVLIVHLDRPSHWARRRWLFVVLEKCDPTKNKFVDMIHRCNTLYPVFRNIAYFL